MQLFFVGLAVKVLIHNKYFIFLEYNEQPGGRKSLLCLSKVLALL